MELAGISGRVGDIRDALFAAVEVATAPVVVIAERGGTATFEWVNRAFCDVVLADPAQLIGRPAERCLGADWSSLSTTRSQRLEVNVRSGVGEMSTWVVEAHPHRNGSAPRWTLWMQSRGELERGDDLAQSFRMLSERAPIGIFSSEVGLRLAYVNDWFAELVGVPAEHLLGMGWTSVVFPEDLDILLDGFQQALAGTPFEGTARLVGADSEERWATFRVVPTGGGGPARFVGTIEDVTDRRRFEELLRQRATRDPLTGLKNRSELVDDIERALASHGEAVGLVFIDLDDFKLVNDLMGHAAGDELLTTVGERLLDVIVRPDVVYRFAGDEFVVLLHDTPTCAEVERAAHRIHRALSLPTTIDGHPTDVGCSVGAAKARERSNAETLLADADAAMYEAKRRGKGSIVMFDPSMSEAHDSREAFERSALEAIDHDRVEFVYEPILCLEDDSLPTIVGPRAVVAIPSWLDGTGERHLGDDLWSAARDRQRVPEMLRACVSDICSDLARWRVSGIRVPWGIVVHLHARDLAMPGFVDHVARCLLRSKLRGDDITLVLGGFDVGVPTVVWNAVTSLRELGVRVWGEWSAITLSSLALRRLQPDGVVIRLGDVSTDDLDGCRALVRMLDEAGVHCAARDLDDDAAIRRAVAIGLRYGSGAALASIVGADDLLAEPNTSHFHRTSA